MNGICSYLLTLQPKYFLLTTNLAVIWKIGCVVFSLLILKYCDFFYIVCMFIQKYDKKNILHHDMQAFAIILF